MPASRRASCTRPLSRSRCRSLPSYTSCWVSPKNVALSAPDRSALLLAPAMSLVVRTLRPAVVALNWLANSTLRLAGVTPTDEVASVFTRDEVAGLVEQSRREGLLDVNEE